ncbi:histone deacetylase family protein [Prosthecomicrobium hirschii]|uniref:histone deacetylase family protein n=1 Tax=Prosthecodimorpha hirschii TaxID=665126 RepID=UPI00221FF216|nr:histone deacetylase family protein [Prosthecomicrobium hirschii]MCW1839635.1 histone deacetylase family protein [Prosthecomicrobium hirschii]
MITLFDAASRRHEPPGFVVAGRLQPSPERPERIDMLLDGLGRLGVAPVAPPPIDLSAAGIVHTERYLAFLATVVERWARVGGGSAWPVPNIHALGRATLPEPSYPDSVIGQVGYHIGDGSAPILPGTLDAMLGAAASALEAARLVAGGERLVYALARPPGHHAAADVAAGFCYLNNSALAAETLVRAGHRVAILDVDVHHGNGTQAIFYDRADVLTVSIHADPARFYPFFWGYAHETGRGTGEGFNLNLPLARGTADADYLAALATALDRVRRHEPTALVVAAGLDASAEDPFQGFAVTTAGFEAIGRAIGALGLPACVIQEGGYPSPSLGTNLAALLGGLGA